MTNRRHEDDTLRTKPVPSPFRFRSRSTKRTQGLILEAINRAGGVGPQAEEMYRQSVDALREDKDAVRVIMAEYDDCPKKQYLDRWSLVMLLSELESPRTLDFFITVVSARLPQPKKGKPHAFNPLREELIIRTTAIDVVGRFAGAGEEAAREALLKWVHHRNFTMRRAAVQAFLEHGAKSKLEAHNILRRELAEEDLGLLKIRRLKVGEAPPIEGERFLSDDPRGVAGDTPRVTPSPDLGATSNSDDTPGA